MVWVQAFPTGATLISQSTGQIQANWLFLQTNIVTDHFFNDATPANEGHHRFTQMLDNGDPALAAGMSGVNYVKATGLSLSTTEQPFFRNAATIRQVPTMLTGQTVIVAPGTVIFDCAALTPFMGWLHVVNPPTTGIYGTAFIWWNGAGTVTVVQSFVAGLTSITGVGSTVHVNVGANIGVSWAVYTIPV
jgi:hypothetical protein